ncbi:MAG: two-component system cell cycle sensor histidine kinase/response regulator CckA [Urechidicola sp.]
MGYPQVAGVAGKYLPEQTSFDNFEVEHEFATIGKRTMLLNARQIKQREGKRQIILLAIEGITESQQTVDKTQELLQQNLELTPRMFDVREQRAPPPCART